VGLKGKSNAKAVMLDFVNNKVPKKAAQNTRNLAWNALRKAIELSPFYSGQFIASWRLAVGSQDTGYAEKGQRPGRGAAAAEARSQVGVGFKLGERIILSNSVPHAKYVEYGSKTTQARYIIPRVKAYLKATYGKGGLR